MGVMGTIKVMDGTGDTKHQWNSDNEAEVEAARALFNALKAKRYRAFHVRGDGEAGEPMENFDPEAEEIIFTPAMQGG